MIATRFTAEDGERAHAEWHCNCGPGALAAILGLTLDQVRPLLVGFEKKGYTNPTLMFDALSRAGVRWGMVQPSKAQPSVNFPKYGLARIQWEGPWTAPGVPLRARYRYTHWVGSKCVGRNVGIFDINAMGNGSGWCSMEDWCAEIVPALIALYPRAANTWHITHAIEVPEPMPDDLRMAG